MLLFPLLLSICQASADTCGVLFLLLLLVFWLLSEYGMRCATISELAALQSSRTSWHQSEDPLGPTAKTLHCGRRRTGDLLA